MDTDGHGTQDGDGPVSGFLPPCVLLLLSRGLRGHEEVRELVTAFGVGRDAAGLEHTLERLEADGMIQTVRGSADGGRDVGYALTPTGESWLATRAEVLAEPARVLDRFLAVYAAAASRGSGSEAAR